jgi:hypothetical protein
VCWKMLKNLNPRNRWQSKKGYKSPEDARKEILSRLSPKQLWRMSWRFLEGQRQPTGLPMPKYQPCPKCHSSCKRQEKNAAGAVYDCHKCHISFQVNRRGGRVAVIQ